MSDDTLPPIDQVADLPALTPGAELDEIRDFLLRFQQWHRVREPFAAGGGPLKFLTKGDLIALGILTPRAGALDGGADTVGINEELFTVPELSLYLHASSKSFAFSSPAATTSASPTVVFTANLQNLTGTVTFTAIAFDADNNSLEAVPLTNVTATTAELTSTDFVNGLGTAVRYVRVTGTLDVYSSSVLIYRSDAGDDALIIEMSKQSHIVATASDGSGGDYSTAVTVLRMLRGEADETSSWDFSIVAESCTATINGEAGPITGANTITIAVSAMSADVARVLITASNGVDPDQAAVFNISRSSVGASSNLVVDLAVMGTAVDLAVGRLKVCEEPTAVTAKLPAVHAPGNRCGAFFTNALTTNVIDRNGNLLDEAAANYTVNPRGKVRTWISLGTTLGWFREF